VKLIFETGGIEGEEKRFVRVGPSVASMISTGKRRISDLLNDEEVSGSSSTRIVDSEERPRTRQRLSSPESSSAEGRRLAFPPRTARARPTPFQQPTPLLTFSYDAGHTLEFTDSAMRYFVEPRRGAMLSYGYERWIRRPDEKGRIDSLLKAWDKVCRDAGGLQVGVVCWRGVMTK
jgi:RAT1-interacting protein